MPSTPLIASSSGVATVSAITLGLAPGYCARTTTEGGTTSGYSAIGRTRIAMRPAITMRSESTPAKIGRSMKNLERFMGAPSAFPAGQVGHLRGLGGDERAGAHALQAVHDDALAGLEAAGDDAKPVHARAQRHLAV